MRHLLVRSLLLTPVLALIAFAQGAVSPASGACGRPEDGRHCGDIVGVPCRCGDTVVGPGFTSLSKSDPVLTTLCPDDGLFATSDVTLKINGTIQSATGTSRTCSGISLVPEPVPGGPPHPATNVVVTAGKIIGFRQGVEGLVASSRFSKLQIYCPGTKDDPAAAGIQLPNQPIIGESNNNIIEANFITGCRDEGIEIFGSGNTVRSNWVEKGNTGIALIGDRNIVSRNLAQLADGQGPGVATNGFSINGDENTVDSNRSLFNGTLGASTIGRGFSILGVKNTVIRNLAQGNAVHGFEIGGKGHSVSFNRSTNNGFAGYFITGMDHRFRANRAFGNGISPAGGPDKDGFTVFANDSVFTRNLTAGNSDFGIDDPGFPGDGNVYEANSCSEIPPSNPPSLCL